VPIPSARKIIAAALAAAAVLCGPTLAPQAGAEPIASGPRAVLRIADGELPTARRVPLGINKSLLIELPVDVQDIVVAQPQLLDAVVLRPRRIYLLAKKAGETNVFFVGRDGQRQLVLEVLIAPDFAELTDTLARLLPGSRIRVTSANDGIVLSGSVASPLDANRAGEIAAQYIPKEAKDAKVINLIATGAKEQVLLKVTVAEMQRDAIRRLGVNLPSLVAKAGEFTFSKVILNNFNATGTISTAAGFVGAGAVPTLQGGNALQTSWASGSGQSVSAILQSLERAGLLRTLAEPNLTAISGETAKFLAGGEFPVPVASQLNTVTVDWKSFGVAVAFTPLVASEGRIHLKVAAEVSELAPDASIISGSISIPGLKVRRAETTVELPSGGALAIAGLLSDETRQSVEGVPELKNLPVLGALFRSRDYHRRESELVVMVTPYLVNPTERAELTRPDQGFAPASELQGLFLGTLNRVYGRPGHMPEGSLKGDYGFIIDYPDDGGSG
jgi:pilus assembly protein CpaC